MIQKPTVHSNHPLWQIFCRKKNILINLPHLHPLPPSLSISVPFSSSLQISTPSLLTPPPSLSAHLHPRPLPFPSPFFLSPILCHPTPTRSSIFSPLPLTPPWRILHTFSTLQNLIHSFIFQGLLLFSLLSYLTLFPFCSSTPLQSTKPLTFFLQSPTR